MSKEVNHANASFDWMKSYLEAAIYHLKHENYGDAKGCVERALQLHARVQPSLQNDLEQA